MLTDHHQERAVEDIVDGEEGVAGGVVEAEGVEGDGAAVADTGAMEEATG